MNAMAQRMAGSGSACLYKEPHRLQYHFSAPRNWINDPCGLVYLQGLYHLFYQYNPHGSQWGHMSWGHAVSEDLLHWRHLPIAIPESDGVMIFTGSVVYDKDNTSGLGTDSRPPLVALYTGFRKAQSGHIQDQRVAYSLDKGHTWINYPGNPVIDLDLSEFRDPMVFWHAASDQWRMAVALAANRQVRFYGSKDLIHWAFLSDFGPESALGMTVKEWECPNLFPLSVDGDPDNVKWVLLVSLNGQDYSNPRNCGVAYFIGDFDGRKFVQDGVYQDLLWVDQGRDFYAPQTWSNSPDGSRIMIGWFNALGQYACETPVGPWRGSHTVPRELSLHTTSQGMRLCQRPVHQIHTLHQRRWTFGDVPIERLQDKITSEELRGKMLQLRLRLRPTSSASTFTLVVKKGRRHYTALNYNRAKAQLTLDSSNSGVFFSSKSFPGVYSAPVELSNDELDIDALLDASSLEIFAANGAAVFSQRMFPDEDANEIEATGTDIIVNLDAFAMKSIWSSN